MESVDGDGEDEEMKSNWCAQTESGRKTRGQMKTEEHRRENGKDVWIFFGYPVPMRRVATHGAVGLFDNSP